MDSLLTNYLNAFCDYAREHLTIQLLEGELEKRKIRRARLFESSENAKLAFDQGLTDAERADVLKRALDEAQRVADTLREENKLKMRIGDNRWALESDERPTLFFDEPGYDRPNVCVGFLGTKPVMVNIRESLVKEPRNIGDPIVVAAIHRYIDCLSMPSLKDLARRRDLREKLPTDQSQPSAALTGEQAEERLRGILDALISGAKSRGRKQAQDFNEVITLLSLSNEKLDDAHFSRLAEILNDEDVSRWQKRSLPTNLQSKLKRALPAVFPDPEIAKRIFEFLTIGKLPKKRTGLSLRNAFFAYERRIDQASFRKYKSESVSQFQKMRGLEDLSLSEIEKIAKRELNRIILHQGIGKLDSFVDVRSSSLVWQEIPVPEAEPESGSTCQ